MPAMQLTPEALRYSSVVRAQASQLQDTLASETDLEQLIYWGNEGLMSALQDFRKRQGTTFQTFAYYSIRSAILNGIRNAAGSAHPLRADLSFHSKANQLLQWYSSSSEGLVKRTFEAEAMDLYQLCQALTVISLLCREAALPAPRETKHNSLMSAISKLSEPDQLFLQSFYFEDRSIQDCASVRKGSLSLAQRSHFKILIALAGMLQHPEN